MTQLLFDRVVVPIVSEEDARATANALTRYVEPGETEVTAVHVIEKAGGAPDKASVEQRELRADDIFDVFRDELAGVEVTVQAEIHYGTDVVETILDAARDADASAVVFTPRGGSRWIRLLTGDVATDLITEADLPVVVLPDVEEGDDR